MNQFEINKFKKSHTQVLNPNKNMLCYFQNCSRYNPMPIKPHDMC